MSQLICDSCGRLYDWGGEYCGAHLGIGRERCAGKLRENECGGPREACGVQGCKECSGKPTPKPHRLSLEECVYWLVVAEALGAASAAARKDPVYLRRERRACREYAKDRSESRVQRRRYIVIAWLCAKAANLIREEQRIKELQR